MGDSEQIKRVLTVQLNALEKIWNESIENSDLHTQRLKLQKWMFETEGLLFRLGEPRPLSAISQMVAEIITDPKARLFEEVKRLRATLKKVG